MRACAPAIWGSTVCPGMLCCARRVWKYCGGIGVPTGANAMGGRFGISGNPPPLVCCGAHEIGADIIGTPEFQLVAGMPNPIARCQWGMTGAVPVYGMGPGAHAMGGAIGGDIVGTCGVLARGPP